MLDPLSMALADRLQEAPAPPVDLAALARAKGVQGVEQTKATVEVKQTGSKKAPAKVIWNADRTKWRHPASTAWQSGPPPK